ncbi:hypothetical protein [Arthrobacter methylotrophus]|uniref:hypothetical protein n=1 Tax=Arthrobacter methylotrophus TaxID=121291 RepID=UPI0031EA6347
MRRDELEHAIRAATSVIRQDQVIIIGSQAILGSYTEDQLPRAATMSPERSSWLIGRKTFNSSMP